MITSGPGGLTMSDETLNHEETKMSQEKIGETDPCYKLIVNQGNKEEQISILWEIS